MKKHVTTVVQTALAGVISALLLTGTLALVSSPKTQNKTDTPRIPHASPPPPTLSLRDTQAMINQVRQYNDCLERLPIDRQNECETMLYTKQETTKKQQVATKSQLHTSFVSHAQGFILCIYFALWGLLSASLFIGFDLLRIDPSLSFDTKEALMSYVLSTPTLLGIAGTMYSMAMFASSSSSSRSLMATFRANITDAIGTTIAGIVVYLIAAAVFAWMHRKERRQCD